MTENQLKTIVVGLILTLLAVVGWSAFEGPGRGGAKLPDGQMVVTELEGDTLNQTVATLLKRVYSGFEAKTESDIYDGIASGVTSDIATDLYLQRRMAQEAEYSEEAAAVILSVEMLSVDVLDETDKGYQVAAKWRVFGRLGHEDHQHERVNVYSAKLGVGPGAEEWRLTSFDLDQVLREDVPTFMEDF